MALPRVSIILPTFNRGTFISDCIEKVIHQRYDDWELIILDDCSSDATEEVCQKFFQPNLNISYYKNKSHLGTPANRNKGLSLSRGELVFFIEDDILLDSNCLNILVETYDQLVREGRQVGGVIPRLINDGAGSPLAATGEPFTMSQWTGEIWNNYSITCDYPKETFTAHACTLYLKKALEAVGNYSTIYIGNFFREETEPPMKMNALGYGLFFQSKAYALHKRYPSGSYYGLPRLSFEWLTIRNHIIFTTRVFGLRSLYMVPLYICKVGVKLVGAVGRGVRASVSRR